MAFNLPPTARPAINAKRYYRDHPSSLGEHDDRRMRRRSNLTRPPLLALAAICIQHCLRAALNDALSTTRNVGRRKISEID